MRSLFSLLLALLTIGEVAADETGGTLIGSVRDKMTNEAVIGANVLIVETGKGAATDINGNFEIREVPPGIYSLRVSYLGYRSQTQTDIVVNNISFARYDFIIEPEDVELQTVEVTSDYFRTNTDAINSLQTFSYEEIRRAPGGQEDVIRAISVSPGVAVVGNGRNDLIVRGGGPSENLFLIDGLEVPNINHFGSQGATGGPLALVNVDFVESTDFSTGGFGVRYGDKLSSVMTIDLREGRTDRLGGKTTLSATGFGANLEGPVLGNGNFLFSVRRSYLDFIFKAAGFGFIPEYWDFQGKMVLPLSNTESISFFGIGALDKVIFNNDTQENQYSNSRILGSDQNQYVVGSTYQNVSRSGIFRLTAGRTWVDFFSRQADSAGVTIFNNESVEAENSLRTEWITRVTPHVEMTVGAQYKWVETNSDLFVNFQNEFNNDPAFAINSSESITGHKGAVFVQFAHQFDHGLDYTAGIRADYFSEISTKWAFNPRLSAGYSLDEQHRVTASLGLYSQSPALTWVVNNPQNRQLDPIKSTQYVLGYEWLFRYDTKLRIEGYYKDYSNYPASVSRPYLVLSNAGAGFGGSTEGFASYGFDPLVSEGTGFSQGIDIKIQKKLSEVPLYGLVSFSVNQTEFTPLNGQSYTGSYSQDFIFNLSGGYQFTDGYELSLKFRAATGLPFTPFNADGSRDVAKYNSERLDATHQLDVRLDKRWNFSNWNLITYIDIQNIYGQQNQFNVQWDVETNSVLKNESIGVLPSIGITAEF